jgi:hypothetical protein
MGNTTSSKDTVIECRISAKELRKLSKRCLDEEKRQAQLSLAAISADKPALARIYAENSVRNKHLAEHYLRMASQTETLVAHQQLRKHL